MPESNAAEIADLEEIGRRAAFEAGNPYKPEATSAAPRTAPAFFHPLDELIREATP